MTELSQRITEFSPEKLALLVDRLKQKGSDASRQRRIPPRQTANPAPLSFAQQRLWFLDQLQPGMTAYNMVTAKRLKGQLVAASLDQSLSEIIRRHEVLRTTFTLIDGEPRQVVAAPTRCALPFTDLSELAAAQRPAEIRRYARELAQQPFDLSAGPLLRARLLRLAEEEHVLLLATHHIISDEWSSGVFFRELATLYDCFSHGSLSPLPELPLQYADYAVWQREWLRSEALEQQLAYWRAQLAGTPALLDLPIDKPRPAVQTYDGAIQIFTLPPRVSEGLRQLCQEQGVTLFMTLLAAFQVLLCRYNGQQHIVVGIPVAGRNRPEVEPLIGCFLNSLPLHTNLSGNPSFNELLQRVKEVCLGAYAHQDVPFDRLVEELHPERSLSHQPLFQVMFQVAHTAAEAGESKGLSWSGYGLDGGDKAVMDMVLALVDSAQGISGSIKYRTDLFESATIKRMAEHFKTLLAGIVDDADQPIALLPLLSETERRQLLVEWNDTAGEYPRDRQLHEWFEAQVERTPAAIAVSFGQLTLTYQELNERANQLGHYLREQGVGPDVLVGIFLERSLEMITAVLGVLKAGGAYFPMDPAYPQQRLAFMIEDTALKVLLTQERLLSRVPEDSVQPVCLDRDWPLVALSSRTNPPRVCLPENLAYVIYTSGSTGKPKGVQIEHRSISNFIDSVLKEVGFSPDDVLAAVTTLTFDMAVGEIFVPLSAGSRVVMISREMAADPIALEQQLVEAGVTVMQATPATWRMLIDSGWAGEPGMRLFSAGEALSRELAEALLVRGRELWNLFGPTETTVFSIIENVVSDAGAVLIGKPMANADVYVLDGEQQPVPVGVVGELYIGGEGLSRGYLNRAVVTAERFLPAGVGGGGAGRRLYRTGDLVRWRSDGRLEYLGRMDYQVKVRGHRIELGEIETVMESAAAVKQTVVVARQDSVGEQCLVAYVVRAAGAEIEKGELRRHLRERLPEYMIPGAIVELDELPLTPNGKVNRRALPEPERSSNEEGSYAAPRTAVEEMLAGIWASVLKLERVGIRDNFFELGGHSLLATRLVTRIREVFVVEVPLRVIFEAPTIAELGVQIELMRAEGNGSSSPAIRSVAREQSIPLSFAQQRLWFLDRMEPGSSFYNIPAPRRIRGALNVAALAGSLNEIIRRHESLRTRFAVVEGQLAQVIMAPQLFELEVTDLSAIADCERTTEVQRRLAEDAQRPFDLANGPLLRASLLRLSAEEHVLLLSMHHIISDGWSLSIFFQELSMLYNAFSQGLPTPLTELETQYADYAVWQRGWLKGEVLDQQLNYWKDQLAGAPPLLKLPTDRARPATQSFHGATQFFSLPAEVGEGLKALSQREGVTLFMTLLTVFKILLARYSGQDDIVVGSPIAGRQSAEVEPLIGFFVNTLALRTNLSGNPSFRELLHRVKEVCLGAYAHQELPFEKLVELLNPERSLSHNPIVQVRLILKNGAREKSTLDGLALSIFATNDETSRDDLLLALAQTGNELGLIWKYKTSLFDDSTITRMSEHFKNLLQSVVAHPEARVTDLEMFSEDERQQPAAVETKRGTSTFGKFKSIKPKAVRITPEEIFKTAYLEPDQTLPLVICPAAEMLQLATWAATNRELIARQLVEHGAILFRNFQVGEMATFAQFIRTVSGELLEYQDCTSPRSRIAGNVYSSTDHPADQEIFMHNENSYSCTWPLKLFFYCVTPALAGGATLLADSRKIYQRLNPRIRERFRELGVMYVRNYGDGFGLPWQTAFQTTDKSAVEQYCRQAGIEYAWKDADRLRTRNVRPAVANHPQTGEPLWFNHGAFFHISTLAEGVRQALLSGFAEEDLPYNTYYGDGSPIEPDVLAEIRASYRRETVTFPWERGDVLMLDNMLTAHGRAPYEGPRKIVVGMSEPCNGTDA